MRLPPAARLHLGLGVLRLDRYLVTAARTLDLASGRCVSLERSREGRTTTALFESRDGRTLIDFEATDDHRVDVWEHWTVRGRPRGVDTLVADFAELLESARLGAPRAFDLHSPRPSHYEFCRRVLAREARVRGWIPIDVEVLAMFSRERRRHLPEWIADRSLVVFAGTPGLSKAATVALLRIARRDVRPHVLVRTLIRRRGRVGCHGRRPDAPSVHERLPPFSQPDTRAPDDPAGESQARWRCLLEELTTGRRSADGALDLAGVLAARDRLFEARALVDAVRTNHPDAAPRAASLEAALNERGASRTRRGWEMVDDFVDVLQICQDVEDEQTALARVGAFLRERLQASSVAFVVRDGAAPRVLARVGPTAAGVDAALRAMDTGVPVVPPGASGPAESACPVRHAAEVIGALWCRWGDGIPIAPQQASTLLGIAAAAAASSLRMVLARTTPGPERANPVPEIVGRSAAIAEVRAAILRAAASPFPVVIEGESGSGKELAARAIHARSARRDRRFCAMNCAALVEDLVEAELFGHARGAFTGAHADRPGVFEEANGGTLFMDEVAELGARVQAKLLRVLQEGEIRRIGETLVRRVDVRIIAATNRPLAREVRSGAFRADLWYRLDVIRITLPPLRERIEDVPVLAQHLWRELAVRTGSRAALSPSAVTALSAYDWPGNIRELQNVLASMLVSAPRAGLVGPSSLPAHVARAAALEHEATLAAARRRFEQRYVRAALARAGGRSADAARALGMTRQGLVKLMARLGISHASSG